MMWNKRYPGLWTLIAGPRYRNLGLFGLILIPNLVAALLEGVSFALILAGLSVFAGDPVPTMNNAIVWFQSLLHLNHQSLFLALIILAVSFQALRSIIGGIALYANSLLALRIQEEAQAKIYQKIFDLSYRCVSQYKIGDLAEYAKTPAVMINVIMDNGNKFLVSLLMVFSTFAVMMALNLKLALLTLVMLGLTGGLHRSIMKKIGRASETLSNSIVDCSKITMQTLQSIRTIHTYNRQAYASGKIHQILNKIIEISKKVYFWNNFIPSINELLGTLFVTAILLAGIWILKGQEEGMLPVLITFLALTHRLAIRIQMGSTALGLIMTHRGSILRLEEILSDQGKEFAPQQGKPFTGLQKGIDLLNVLLQYPTADKPALHKVSLTIPKGQTVAFVGSSGAGKSSLLDLLLRLYEPNDGAIHIDGVDLREYSIGSWRNCLGVVSQDISIFNDTIEENIRFGLSEKTPHDVLHAAQLAGLDDFVQTLPEQYHTVVGERGFRLSGGQRQRLALARALIRNPQILILDEATSNLDSHSEFLIQNALETLRADRTILIVAHRLSTIVNADRIYVLNEGQITENGTHTELLANKSTYANFWERQSSN